MLPDDHNKRERLCIATGEVSPTGLPKANALRYLLPGGAWAVVRPSGTEPKLKVYIGAVGESREAGEAQLERLMGFMDSLLGGLLA